MADVPATCGQQFVWQSAPYGVMVLCELDPEHLDGPAAVHAGRVAAYSPAYTVRLEGHVVRWQEGTQPATGRVESRT